MYRKYYSYNDMPQPVFNNPPREEQPPPPQPVHIPEKEICLDEKTNNKILGKFEMDDIILAIVAFMLLSNDCDDNMLLIAIAFIFFSGF